MHLPTRRAFQHDPGEPLLLPADVVTLMSRYARFARIYGIESQHLCVSSLVSTPMVDPSVGVRELSPSPDSLWHPLLWLPPRLHRQSDEEVNHWMVRVALEMSDSGLYEMTDGTWYDMMADVGISVDYAEGRQRITEWLAGGDDADLDNISMEKHLDVGDVSWASDAADDMLDDLTVVAASRSAHTLFDVIDGALDSSDPIFDNSAHRVDVATTAAVASLAFLGHYAPAYNVDFAALRDQIHDGTSGDLHVPGSPAQQLRTVLDSIYQDTSGREKEMIEAFSDHVASVSSGDDE